MRNERNCKTCGRKSTCLKRSTSIFVLYIQSGRSNELTEEIRDNFDCSADCEHYVSAGGAKCNDS